MSPCTVGTGATRRRDKSTCSNLAGQINTHTDNNCDRICENVHSSHIQFFNFEDPRNLLGMKDKLETFRGYRTTIPLSFLQMLDLCIVPSGFYESLNEKNRMCELCTFSQIRSQLIFGTHFYCGIKVLFTLGSTLVSHCILLVHGHHETQQWS